MTIGKGNVGVCTREVERKTEGSKVRAMRESAR